MLEKNENQKVIRKKQSASKKDCVCEILLKQICEEKRDAKSECLINYYYI